MNLRLVLDTNVLLSGLLFGGPPKQILELGLDRSVELSISPSLLEEFERVLNLKFPHASVSVRQTWETLRRMMRLVIPDQRIHIITQDPDDNRVLECALAAKAHLIVSGDKHLLGVKVFRTIPILNPAEFLARYRKH